MQITISPVAGIPGEPETTISVSGAVVTVDGVAYDTTTELAEPNPFVGPVTPAACTIRFVYDPATAEADQPTDPALWQVTVADGAVPDLILRGAPGAAGD